MLSTLTRLLLYQHKKRTRRDFKSLESMHRYTSRRTQDSDPNASNMGVGSPATLGVFDCITVLVWVPLYDRFNVPLAKLITRTDNGFTVLQRIGIGLVISVFSIVSAAIVEKVRLGVVEKGTAVSLTVLWQVPQIFILGAAEVFYCVGQLEFFYGQSPESMRSLCCALGLLTNAFGSYLSSLLLTVVTYLTTLDGRDGWITDDLNEGHLDYFFWLLAGLSNLNAVVYVFSAVNYKQKKAL
ncbi:hypothetical protein Bca52824_079027 [Brassica carinata]|uniref:Uncharacterized protein n=1 Tax=Brassica carinata TaxID=52824 RepID=A0A8X7PZ13_BRACI|nr:hypothetical protein Bca52824_079027 [Brassica carinata]